MLRFDNSLLVLRAGTLWQEATAAAFLDAIGDGTLPPEAFNRWLVQDYHFADALSSFQGIAATKDPAPASQTADCRAGRAGCRAGLV